MNKSKNIIIPPGRFSFGAPVVIKHREELIDQRYTAEPMKFTPEQLDALRNEFFRAVERQTIKRLMNSTALATAVRS